MGILEKKGISLLPTFIPNPTERLRRDFTTEIVELFMLSLCILNGVFFTPAEGQFKCCYRF
jgi:hypothetical protein